MLKLAPVMLERWADTRFIPAGRIGLKFRAGAYLDAGGVAEGQAIMRAAEAELAGAERSSVWETRFAALGAYHGTERLMPYLEYLADRMIEDRHLAAPTAPGAALPDAPEASKRWSPTMHSAA